MMVDSDSLSKMPEYQYHLKDHLGNVRLTFSATPDIETETATLETAHVEEEYATFLRYAETTKINSTLFDHTGSGDTHYAVRLNGAEHERIGLAKSLAVMTGDTIKTEVYAKYLDPDPNNWTAALQNLMAAIAGGTAPTGTVIEAVPSVGGDGFPFAGLLDAAKAGDTGTRAYLNILLFDENLGFLDAAYVPVSMAAREDGTNVPHEKLSGEIVVQQPGYAYIYFSNDNDQPLEVFFDDFTVEHAHSAIVQADDYYPFGLSFNSYRREDGMMNRYKFNGKEEQEETNWLDYGRRMYQPEIGRFFVQDRFAEKYFPMSPYQYAANNPINLVDVNGDSLWVSYKTANDNGSYTFGEALYNQGVLYNEDGSEYSGENEFVDQAYLSILSLESSGEAAGRISELSGSEHNFKIVESTGGNSFQADSPQNGVKGGGTIGWNPNSAQGVPTTDGFQTNSTISLAHEMLGHGIQANRGEISDKTYKGLSVNEWGASSVENMIRRDLSGALGTPLRTHYNVSQNVSTGVLSPGGPRLLQKVKGLNIYIDRYNNKKRKMSIPLGGF